MQDDVTKKQRRTDLIAIGFLLIVAIAFCGRAVFTGRVMMPLDMLLLMSPWKAHTQQLAPNFAQTQNQMLDPIQQYYPWRMFAVSSVKSGTIPLWNPYSYCGQPFLANLQSALFYPLNLIFLILPIGAAFSWGAVLHLFLAGMFCYTLLRTWRLGTWPALVGAVAFMLNGFIIGWLEYPAVGQWVIVWLPALLLCHEWALIKQSWLWAGLCGLVIGIQFCGGHLQISLYLLMTFLLYVVWRSVGMRSWRGIGFAALALGLGAALAMVQLLPSLELIGLSARTPKTLTDARSTALPATHLILYLMPKFFGSPAGPVGYWGNLVSNPNLPINYFETGCYVGIVTLLLAWLAIRWWRQSQVGFLLALTAISLLVAMGTPVFTVLFYIGPGMKQLAGVARILCLTAFGLSGLAAFGMERLLNYKSAGHGNPALHKPFPIAKWELLVFGCGVVLLVVLARVVFAGVLEQNQPIMENYASQLYRFAVFFLVSLLLVWLITRLHAIEPVAQKKKAKEQPNPVLWQRWFAPVFLAILLIDLFSFGFTFNPATDARLAFFPTETTDFLRRHADHARMVSYKPPTVNNTPTFSWMLPNTPLAYDLRDTHGYDSLVPGRYTRLMGTTDWGVQGSWPAAGSNLANLLGIKYAATVDQLNVPGWKLAAQAEMNIYENTRALPRAFAVYNYIPLTDSHCLERMQKGDVDDTAVLMIGDENWSPTWSLPPPPKGSVRFNEDSPNKITLETELPQTAAEAQVVLMDSAYPGWKVTVDGQPSLWQIANYDFRVVSVPAGRHTITWRYEPTSFRVGLFISLAALGALCAGLISALMVRLGQKAGSP
jgi:hypothetical protein